jgi:D-arginine dehydrogenase
MFLESYGTPQVCALTKASRAFLQQPPPGFCDQALLSPRGALMVATEGQQDLLAQQWELFKTITPHARLLSAEETCAKVPVLRGDKVLGSVFDSEALDMDVDALHQGYLRAMRRAGGRLVCKAEVSAIERLDGVWQVQAGGIRYQAPVVINAAGAWADQVALLAGVAPIGVQPKRRSAFIFAPPEGVVTTHWPLTLGLADDWYFKPDAGMLLGSPANEDDTQAQDVQPEELDIALGIHRIEEVSTMQIRRPTRTWAGLRSFVPDGDLVGGFDTQTEGFFWVAGQGGSGIMSSSAMGEACVALLLGRDLPTHIVSQGTSAQALSPARLQVAAS